MTDAMPDAATDDIYGPDFLDRFKSKHQPATSAQATPAKPTDTSEKGWLKLHLKDVLDRRRDVIFSPHTRLLVYLAVKSKGGRRVVPLTNMMAAEVGLHRQQKSRSLRHLEQNGYVTVERCGQEAPRVTVLDRGAG